MSKVQAAIVVLLVAALPAVAADPLPPAARADRLVLKKHLRELTLMSEGRPMRIYRVSLGANPEGHKVQEGDERTPEGTYRISGRNPNSKFHRSLRISYPNDEDRARAAKLGVPPGGDIMIHGMRNGFGWLGRLHRLFDWTDGCIAVTNSEMDEIWRTVPNGTIIEINR